MLLWCFCLDCKKEGKYAELHLLEVVQSRGNATGYEVHREAFHQEKIPEKVNK